MQSAAKSLSFTNVKFVAKTNPPHLRSNSSRAVTLTPAFINNSAPKRVLKSVIVSLSSSSCSTSRPRKKTMKMRENHNLKRKKAIFKIKWFFVVSPKTFVTVFSQPEVLVQFCWQHCSSNSSN